MTPAEFAQLRQLFDELHGIPVGLRAPRLESVDPSLRDQLVQLLALAQGSSVDAQLPTQVDRNDPAPPRAAIAAATAIGPYRLVDSLGRGGMGVVYRARHELSGQEVALKLVRPERATADLLRRFEFEMRVLARLEHPSIARILHAGTVELDGEPCPYLALELVRGVQLLEYANKRRLSLRARLDLFVRVVDAVQYAHGQGVIHRDLKPANIFVNSDGLPKILDFGIARVIATETPQTLLTAPGELVGTPTHMSPEQLKGDPAQIDIRTDVYSLGVILYELLTAEWPYGHRDLPLPMLARVILEDEPRPPRTLAPGIDREIELITLRSLEKEPARRYQTADGLSLDLRRYLRHEPIEARSPTAGYLLRKFYRRNRILCLGAASTMLALIIGLGGTTYGFWQQSRERARAEKAVHLRSEFEEMLDHVLLRVQSPELKVAEVAQALAAELNNRTADTETQAYLLSRVGSFLLGAGDYAGARAGLTRAWRLIISDPGLSELQAPVAMSLARLCFEADADFAAAEMYLTIALANAKGGAAADPAPCWQQMGQLYAEADRLQEARTLLLKALAESRDASLHRDIYNDLGYVDVLMGEYAEAEAYYRAALRLEQQNSPYDTVAAATTEGNLAMALAYQGLCDEAEAVVQQAYQAQLKANGPEHRGTLAAMAYCAFVAACRDDLQLAVERYQAVLKGQEKWFGDKPQQAKAFTKFALAAVLAECGATEAAEALRAAGEADYTELIGRPHRTALWFYYGLRGLRCERRGDLAAAESAYSDGVQAFEALGPAGGSFAALCRLGRARVKSMSGVFGVAALAEGAVGELERIHGGKSPLVASASVDLGIIRARAGDTEGACDAWQRAITIRAEGPDIAAWTAAAVHWQVTGLTADDIPVPDCAFAGREQRDRLLEVLPESDRRRVLISALR